jgi:hypothetical protein
MRETWERKERIARTVECPRCGVPADAFCVARLSRTSFQGLEYTHPGRYELALRRIPPGGSGDSSPDSAAVSAPNSAR